MQMTHKVQPPHQCLRRNLPPDLEYRPPPPRHSLRTPVHVRMTNPLGQVHKFMQTQSLLILYCKAIRKKLHRKLHITAVLSPHLCQFVQLLSQLSHQVRLHQVHMMPGHHSAGIRPQTREYVEMGSQVSSSQPSVISQNWHNPAVKKFHLDELVHRKKHIERMMRQLELDAARAQTSREFTCLPYLTPLAPQDISLYRGKKFYSDTGVKDRGQPITRGMEYRQQKLAPACPSYYRTSIAWPDSA